RVYRGDLPDPSETSPDFARLDAFVRLGSWRRAALAFLKLPDGWLLECRDATASEAAARFAASTLPDDGAEAMLEAIAEAFRLDRAVLTLQDDGAGLRPCWAVPAAAPTPEPDTSLEWDLPVADACRARFALVPAMDGPSL